MRKCLAELCGHTKMSNNPQVPGNKALLQRWGYIGTGERVASYCALNKILEKIEGTRPQNVLEFPISLLLYLLWNIPADVLGREKEHV